jgi:hypothetical protein
VSGRVLLIRKNIKSLKEEGANTEYPKVEERIKNKSSKNFELLTHIQAQKGLLITVFVCFFPL